MGQKDCRWGADEPGRQEDQVAPGGIESLTFIMQFMWKFDRQTGRLKLMRGPGTSPLIRSAKTANVCRNQSARELVGEPST